MFTVVKRSLTISMTSFRQTKACLEKDLKEKYKSVILICNLLLLVFSSLPLLLHLSFPLLLPLFLHHLPWCCTDSNRYHCVTGIGDSRTLLIWRKYFTYSSSSPPPPPPHLLSSFFYSPFPPTPLPIPPPLSLCANVQVFLDTSKTYCVQGWEILRGQALIERTLYSLLPSPLPPPGPPSPPLFTEVLLYR